MREDIVTDSVPRLLRKRRRSAALVALAAISSLGGLLLTVLYPTETYGTFVVLVGMLVLIVVQALAMQVSEQRVAKALIKIRQEMRMYRAKQSRKEYEILSELHRQISRQQDAEESSRKQHLEVVHYLERLRGEMDVLAPASCHAENGDAPSVDELALQRILFERMTP